MKTVPQISEKTIPLILITADVIFSKGSFVCAYAKTLTFASLYAAEAGCVLASSLIKEPFNRDSLRSLVYETPSTVPGSEQHCLVCRCSSTSKRCVFKSDQKRSSDDQSSPKGASLDYVCLS